MATAAFHSHLFGVLVKGRPRELVRAGQVVEKQMRHSSITRHDLEEALREHGADELAQVASARLERSGNISVVRRDG